jgi:hypothetical protein
MGSGSACTERTGTSRSCPSRAISTGSRAARGRSARRRWRPGRQRGRPGASGGRELDRRDRWRRHRSSSAWCSSAAAATAGAAPLTADPCAPPRSRRSRIRGEELGASCHVREIGLIVPRSPDRSTCGMDPLEELREATARGAQEYAADLAAGRPRIGGLWSRPDYLRSYLAAGRVLVRAARETNAFNELAVACAYQQLRSVVNARGEGWMCHRLRTMCHRRKPAMAKLVCA